MPPLIHVGYDELREYVDQWDDMDGLPDGWPPPEKNCAAGALTKRARACRCHLCHADLTPVNYPCRGWDTCIQCLEKMSAELLSAPEYVLEKELEPRRRV